MRYLVYLLIISAACVAGGCLNGRSLHNPLLERSFNLDRGKKMDDKAFEKALKRKGTLNFYMKNGATPLIMAVLRNRPDRLKRLLEEHADPNFASKRGSTPLHVAAGLARNECIELLLKAGATVDQPDGHGRTPLMEAARTGNPTIMERLLKAGAKIHAADNYGRTALMHAAEAQKNTLQSVKFLVSKGADPMGYDKDLKLAVMHATEMKHTDAALYLLELIPDLPQKSALGLVIMHSAIQGGDIKMVDKLIDKRVPLNRELSLMIQGSRFVQIHGAYRILVRTGALDKRRTPIHWAALNNNLEIVKLLIRRGADPLQPDELGDTADELTTSRAVYLYIVAEQKKMLQTYKEMEK